MANLLRKSNVAIKALTQHRRIRLKIPGRSCFALSTEARTKRTTKINSPEKHIVPKDGPNAFLQHEKDICVKMAGRICTANNMQD